MREVSSLFRLCTSFFSSPFSSSRDLRSTAACWWYWLSTCCCCVVCEGAVVPLPPPLCVLITKEIQWQSCYICVYVNKGMFNGNLQYIVYHFGIPRHTQCSMIAYDWAFWVFRLKIELHQGLLTYPIIFLVQYRLSVFIFGVPYTVYPGIPYTQV